MKTYYDKETNAELIKKKKKAIFGNGSKGNENE